MRINEIFGPTIQGEGPFMGRHCLFVRMFGCNLECTWCDTPQTWATTPEKAEKHHLRILLPDMEGGADHPEEYIPKVWDEGAESTIMEAGEVLDKLASLWPQSMSTIVVISGGEPLMQQGDEEFQRMVQIIRQRHEIHIETAGTIAPNSALQNYVTQWVVSPKLNNSGNILKKRYKPEVINSLRDLDAAFKFVVKTSSDLYEVDDMVSMHALERRNVWVMPEGTSWERLDETTAKIVEDVTMRGYNLGQRLHINIWGDKRGV
jgi:7-carboxy-7-deazaguanine synthase